MEKKDVWTLIVNDEFECASEVADEEYNRTKDLLPLQNKVYALFHLRKYDECVELTQRLIQLNNGNLSVDYINCAIAFWLLGKQSEGVKMWLDAEKSLYKDAAGGMNILVFLFYASIKVNDELLRKDVVKKIKKLLKSKVSANWPGVLGSFILNDVNEDYLFPLVSTVPILRERQLCQVYFAIATKALEMGDVDKYKSELHNSIRYGKSSYLEQMYYLAKGELEKMTDI